MSFTSTNTSPPVPLQTILQRIALPLTLFSAALLSLLLLSYLLVLPRFTRLHRPDGTALAPRAIVYEQRMLSAQLLEKEEQREQLVLPVIDPQYRTLVGRKQEQATFGEVSTFARSAFARLGENMGALDIQRVEIEDERITMEGAIRGVGTRSMTVLAAFVEELEQSPEVDDVDRPDFSRSVQTDGSIISPFVLYFSFRHQ